MDRRIVHKKKKLLQLGLLYVYAERNTKRYTRRYWVHPVNQKRTTEGAWETFVKGCRESYPEKYKDILRMDAGCFNELLGYVREAITKNDTVFRKAICVEQRLTLTLFYLSSGDSFKTLSILFRLGQSTVRAIIFETCEAIWTHMRQPFCSTPSTEAEWKQIAKGFYDLWNFPNCLGAVDGKHCSVQCPPNTGSEYFNYKKFFSIVLLGVCDAHYRFIYIDVGTAGRWSDGGTWDQCNLNTAITSGNLNIPEPAVLPG